MPLKPSATAPISSFDTTRQRTSSAPSRTCAIARCSVAQGRGDTVGDERGQADRGHHPAGREHGDDDDQVAHDAGRRFGVGTEQRIRTRQGRDCKHGQRHQAQQQKHDHHARTYAQARHTRSAEVALGKNRGSSVRHTCSQPK